MSIVNSLKKFLSPPDRDEGTDTTVYECQDCGHSFESAKSPDRVQCIECLSRDTEPR